jgi:hypothetical protein
MEESLLFISNSLHDTCVARLNGVLPSIPTTLDNPFLTHKGDGREATVVEAECLENGILLASDSPLNYEEFIAFLKGAGIEVEQIGVDICG